MWCYIHAWENGVEIVDSEMSFQNYFYEVHAWNFD